jgi:hypothetical protein
MPRGLKLGLGIPLTVIGFFMALGGSAVLAFVGADGTFRLEDTSARSDGNAIYFDAIAIRGDLPQTGSVATTIEVDVSSSEPVFVGVGPTPRVDAYLEGVPADRIVQVDWPGGMRTEEVTGTVEPEPPGDQDFWIVQDEGTDASFDWTLDGGSWTVVIMNADASSDVDVDLAATVTLPILGPTGIVILVVGLGALVGGVLLTISGARMPKATQRTAPTQVGTERPTVPPGPPGDLPPPPP